MSQFSAPSRAMMIALPLALIAAQAGAHTGHGMVSGFANGLAHPIMGLDHVVAMIAVGLWAALLDRPALWMLPSFFPVVMVLGGALGMMGMALPAVEAWIALSGVVLGLLVALAVRAPVWVSALVVGVFAVFHGHAHGTELPEAYGPYGYAAGFFVSTVLLHVTGMALGLFTRSSLGKTALRGTGGAIALVGATFLFGIA